MGIVKVMSFEPTDEVDRVLYYPDEYDEFEPTDEVDRVLYYPNEYDDSDDSTEIDPTELDEDKEKCKHPHNFEHTLGTVRITFPDLYPRIREILLMSECMTAPNIMKHYRNMYMHVDATRTRYDPRSMLYELVMREIVEGAPYDPHAIMTLIKFAACSRNCAGIYNKLICWLIEPPFAQRLIYMGADCWIEQGRVMANGPDFIANPHLISYHAKGGGMLYTMGKIKVFQNSRMLKIDAKCGYFDYMFNYTQGNSAYICETIIESEDKSGITEELSAYFTKNGKDIRHELYDSSMFNAP